MLSSIWIRSDVPLVRACARCQPWLLQLPSCRVTRCYRRHPHCLRSPAPKLQRSPPINWTPSWLPLPCIQTLCLAKTLSASVFNNIPGCHSQATCDSTHYATQFGTDDADGTFYYLFGVAPEA